MRLSILSTVALLFACTSGALASSSAWHKAEGVRMRIVTKGAPDASGLLRGVLQIDLKRGWKTYWRDPGGSGVPPSIDVSGSSNVALAELAFPAPMRFDDESGPWNGYKHSVAFPVSFRLAEPAEPVTIGALVFIGACETICVPVQAELTLDPTSDPNNPDDAMIVDDAFAMLPQDAQPDFGVAAVSSEADAVQVTTRFPGKADGVELFVAGVDGYTLGMPERTGSDDAATFSVPVIDRPAPRPDGKGLPYTLVTQAGAVQGFLPYP